jgi:hypothetical protein
MNTQKSGVLLRKEGRMLKHTVVFVTVIFPWAMDPIYKSTRRLRNIRAIFWELPLQNKWVNISQKRTQKRKLWLLLPNWRQRIRWLNTISHLVHWTTAINCTLLCTATQNCSETVHCTHQSISYNKKHSCSSYNPVLYSRFTEDSFLWNRYWRKQPQARKNFPSGHTILLKNRRDYKQIDSCRFVEGWNLRNSFKVLYWYIEKFKYTTF